MNHSGQANRRAKEPGFLLIVVLLLMAFSSGAAVMVVELAAARILTPFFGQSVFVWTNVIGVILASIAAGNYLGGRFAAAAHTLRPLAAIFLAAGLLCLAAPFMIGRVAGFFLGSGLQLEEAFSLLVRGSFAATLLVFAPPVLLLGMALPFIVKAAAATYGEVGRASGSVYAASTAGSIAGTFVTTYLLTETLGSRGTFFFAGVSLVVLAAVTLVFLGGRRSALPAAGLAAAAAVLGAVAPGGPDTGALWERESRYQYIRVVEQEGEPRTLHLCINEGLDSFHSIYREGEILTGGQYFDYYSLLPALAGLEEPGDVCLIGLAAGTIARQYAHFFGGSGRLAIDGVELDPEVVRAGYEFMDLALADPWLSLYLEMDGRVFLAAAPRTYDVIVIDAYAQQVYIPFHMTTAEFFALVWERLEPGGVVGMNLSGFTRDEPVVRSIANTVAAAFGSASLARIPDGRNFMLYAVKGKGAAPPGDCDPGRLPAELRPLLDAISVFGLTRNVAFDCGQQIYTDDRSPVELASDRTLMRRSTQLIESLPDEG